MMLAAAGFAWAARADNIPVALVAMSLVAIGLWSTMGPSGRSPPAMVGGAAAAGAVATITTIGGFGGFLGPYFTGLMRDATHSFAGGLYAIGALALCAALLTLAAPSNPSRPLLADS